VNEPREVRIPDLGTDEKVDVVDVLVTDGDTVEKDDGLVTLESDKATMDVPSPVAGTIQEVAVKVGDQVGEGDLVLTLTTEGASAGDESDEKKSKAKKSEPEDASPKASKEKPQKERTSEKAPSGGGDESGDGESGGSGKQDRGHASSSSSASASVEFDTELVVIGGGPGGYTAAFRAADLGMDVTLVERYPILGGVCLNVGCIPSKALLHVAEVIGEAKLLEEHGVHFGAPKIDLDELRSWKSSVVERLTSGLAKMAEQRGVTVVQGSAHFTGSHEIRIATADGASDLSFGQAIVAAGSRVIDLPDIPMDDPRVLDSTDALELREIPKRLLVVGGGIIGLEMAMVYGALGSELTVVELLDGLVPGCDRDLVRPLERRLKKELGADIYLETKVDRVETGKKGLTVHLEGKKAPETVEADMVLVAVGRRPNGDLLDARAAGLEVDDRGFISVDRQMRSNVPHIFAIGDITGQPMLAHKATHEGKVAAEVASGEQVAFDARVIPSVAYTDPEIAWVGLTETEAGKKETPYEATSFPWAASGRALGMGRGEGRTKLLFDPETKRILGGGIVGPGAGDLIAEIALAIEMDCEAKDLALTIHPHPTVSETVAFAAEVFDGTITDLYLGKKRKRS
jgi:dihydrolipoamide dehydrogenase